MADSRCDNDADVILKDNRFSMYSSSCPNDSKCSLLTKLDNGCATNNMNNCENEQEKYKSEDCLSMISDDFDQCPELDDLAIAEEEEGSFELLGKDYKPRQSNSSVLQRPQNNRRGSDAMKELSVVILNKINRKFYSMRMGEWLKIKTKINCKVPVYLLGRKYLFNNVNYANLMGKKEFMLDFTSKFWFTYRQNFVCLPCSKTVVMTVPEALRSSDCGWGCMVRSGQMMMAQALSVHFLGRNWRRTSTCQRDLAFHRQIIKWFGDTPKVTSPFSIHQILRISDQNPGEWFGPQSVCNALTEALHESQVMEPKLESIKIYFAQDRIIYRDEVIDMVKVLKNEEDINDLNVENHNSLIIFIPLYLGTGTYCSPSFQGVVSKWLRDPFCLGIIGGKPRHSIYIIGCQDKNIIYLDPHVLQDAVNMAKDKFSIDTFHCMQPLVMPYKYLDPSCAVGFYCRNVEEVEIFLEKIQNMSTVHMNIQKVWRSQATIEVLPGHSDISSSVVENL